MKVPRVADGDVWYRCLLNTGHYKGGKLQHAALRGKAFAAPEATDASWKSEVSGRLRSVADDIREFGERRANLLAQNAIAAGKSGKNYRFVGVIYSAVGDVRRWNLDRADVVFAPNKDPASPYFDPAHANLVFATKPPDQMRTLTELDDLMSRLGHYGPSDLHKIPAATGGQPRQNICGRLLSLLSRLLPR